MILTAVMRAAAAWTSLPWTLPLWLISSGLQFRQWGGIRTAQPHTVPLFAHYPDAINLLRLALARGAAKDLPGIEPLAAQWHAEIRPLAIFSK